MLLRRYHENRSATKLNDIASVAEKPVSYGEMTNEQLKELLDAKGIEYKSRANKQELLELLQGTI